MSDLFGYREDRVSHDATHMIKVGFTSLCFILFLVLFFNIDRQYEYSHFLFAATIRNSIKLFVASVLYCSIYHCTSFEKNEIEKFGILIFDDLFIRDFRIIPEGENMSIQCR